MALFFFPRRKRVEETVRERLIAMLEPRVNGLGYELVELEHSGALLRLFIDKPGVGITVDDCELVSRQVSAVLDAEDPIGGHFTLEVSSPGLERPLRTAAHFAAWAGKRVKLELRAPLDGELAGRRRFTGTLLGVEQGPTGDEVMIEVDDRTYKVPLRALGKARLVA